MGSSASLSLLSSSPSWLPPPPHRRETPDRWWLQMQQQQPPLAPIHLVSTAASLRLYSYVKELSRLCYAPLWKDVWCSKRFPFKEMDFLQFSNDIFRSACSPCLYFANGEGIRKGSGNEGTPNLEAPRRDSFGRQWTNILLAANVLVFAAQIATQGKLLLWGAKVNSLIEKGQVWRLVTSSFLHANIGHLMVNCFSLNSIGPTIENLSGARRYLSIYFTSAIASSAASYYFSKAPAVGASGAIFGLVGSLAVFVVRHKGMIRGGKEDLQHIAQVILLNMVIGALSRGIDNFGHTELIRKIMRGKNWHLFDLKFGPPVLPQIPLHEVGGLLGGVATSWLVGPAWKREALSDDGQRIFVDRAPIKSLTNRSEQ